MRFPVASYLPALLLACCLALVSGLLHTAGGQEPHYPPSPQVVRIYYDEIADLDQLRAYDLFEANNLAKRYVLAALSPHEINHLRALGWTIEPRPPESLQMDRLRYYGDYRTVDEIYTKIDTLSGQYPALSELVPYGQSYCKTAGGCTTPGGDFTPGADLLAVRVTNETLPGASVVNGTGIERGSKPVFILVAGIHARELTVPEIALRWLELLLEQYGLDPDITWLVDYSELWIIPTANPDGHWITELGDGQSYGGFPLMHRKNFDSDADADGKIDCSVWPSTSYSQFGVDLNRNHSFGWLEPAGTATACSLTYAGPSAASEPETAALQDLVRALITDSRGDGLTDPAAEDTSGFLLTLHNYGELVLRPWGFSNSEAPDEPLLKAIGDKLASFNGYRSCRPPQCLYSAHGTTDDWAYGELGIPAYTLEIGSLSDGFSPPYAVIDAVQWPQNRGAFLYAALLARSPYTLIQGPDVSRLHLAPHAEPGRIWLTAEFDETAHGGESIAFAEFSIDTPFWQPGARPAPMQALRPASEAPRARFRAAIDISTLSAEPHIIFVRGIDSAGSTGVTRSLFYDMRQPLRSSTYFPIVSTR